MDRFSKENQLQKLDPNAYRIYGIYNFRTEKLMYVNLELDKVMLEFDLEGYDRESYDIVLFDVVLT